MYLISVHLTWCCSIRQCAGHVPLVAKSHTHGAWEIQGRSCLAGLAEDHWSKRSPPWDWWAKRHSHVLVLLHHVPNQGPHHSTLQAACCLWVPHQQPLRKNSSISWCKVLLLVCSNGIALCARWQWWQCCLSTGFRYQLIVNQWNTYNWHCVCSGCNGYNGYNALHPVTVLT